MPKTTNAPITTGQNADQNHQTLAAGLTFNEWFLSLPEGRQAILREDKWMLADAAFEGGKQVAATAPTLPRADDTTPNDESDPRGVAKAFAAANLPELCGDVLVWGKTGRLQTGCLLQTMAGYCTAYLDDPADAPREAERLVTRMALERLSG